MTKDQEKDNSVVHLTLKTLHELSDTLPLRWDQEMESLVRDCQSRPQIAATRKLVLEVHLKPNENDDQKVDITPQLKSSMPARRFDQVTALATADNQLKLNFNEGTEDP
jgi:hypothetical protein